MIFSSELRLLAQCCRRAFRGGERQDPEGFEGVDWERFVALGQFHRVEGFAWDSLAATPAARRLERLKERAAAIAAQNLVARNEIGAILRLFNSAGLECLVLKGQPLAVRAYDSPQLKNAIDIDLLIEPGDLDAAAALLRSRGFASAEPNQGGSERELRAWHAVRKDSEWAKSRLQLDLHTRLADNPRLLGGLDARAPAQSIDLGAGVTAPALSDDLQFVHLAVHGASSCWFRLKWISDFAALLSTMPPGEITRHYRSSGHFGAARAAGQALLLAQSLFGTLDALPELQRELEGNHAIRRLHAAAAKQLALGAEPTAKRLGTLRIHWTQFLLLPDRRFMVSELIRQARAALP